MAMPAWADRRRGQAHDIADLFAEGSAADAWAALNAQPLSALVKPALPGDEQVPVVEIGAGQDLDAIAGVFALDEDPVAK